MRFALPLRGGVLLSAVLLSAPPAAAQEGTWALTVSDRYGSVEAGKVANLMVTTGDPLDVRTTVRHLFINGQLVPQADRHTRLYEQFRARPSVRTSSSP